MENQQEAMVLARQIRVELERCSDELTWDVSVINEVYAQLDEAADAARRLERRVAALK